MTAFCNLYPKVPKMAQFLTIQSVAERYQTSKHSVYRWIRDDRNFPSPIRLPAGSPRWAIADLEEWEAQQKSAA
jgi:predicted DNA-binding transcriptional regulator AlpA